VLIEAGPAPRFVMRWAEHGGPRVQRPSRTGFGHTVIKDVVQQGLEADVQLEYAQAGFEWSFSACAAVIVAPTETAAFNN
jgi:two-component sensor histidine kinase